MRKLLGIGGSEDSFRALEHTVERVAVADDELTVCIVENPVTEIEPDAIAERVRGVLDDAGVDADVRVVEGHPGSRLVEIAESEEFDEIVLGGGMRSPMGKIEVGNVAEYVIMNSRVTVKLVR